MEFKGTKGKLTAREAKGPKGELLYYMVSRNGSTVADFGPNPYSDPPITMQAAKANAVIYSKAHEMLEMLNRIVYNLENEECPFDEEEIKKLIKEATEL